MAIPRHIEKDILLLQARDWFEYYLQGKNDNAEVRKWIQRYQEKLECRDNYVWPCVHPDAPDTHDAAREA